MFVSGDSIAKLERALAIPDGILINPIELSNRELIIICHALAEAAVLDQSASRTPGLQFRRVVRRLFKNDFEPRRLVHVDVSALKSTSQRAFFRGLTDLRNEVVTELRSGVKRDARNSYFSFDAHLASLGANERKQFGRVFRWTNKIDAPRDDWPNQVFCRPDMAIWLNTLGLLASVYDVEVTLDYWLDDVRGRRARD